jgi:hypothetical protein
MQLRSILAITTLGALAACVPGSPVYFGSGFSTVSGTLFALEDMTPIASAEVCFFGSDTTCVRTEPDGTYEAFVTEVEPVEIRFRLTGARPAIISDLLLMPEEAYLIDCVMSTLMTLSTEPGSCRENRTPAGN